MTPVYRILRRRYARQAFDGEGAYRFGGRWSSPGTRLVYTSEHASLAMIEYFVHLDALDPPPDLVLAVAEVPDTVSRVRLSAHELPGGWRRTPAPAALVAIGDGFAGEVRAAILIVPSALSPTESNWLLNPAHPHFTRIRARRPEAFASDPRFFG